MSRFLEVLPRKLVALVAVPLVVGLLLLGLLFDLGSTGWLLLLLAVVGGVLAIVFVGARTVLLEKQRGPAGSTDGE
jgi:ABC-type transport system involved in cytochrome c biogenesis permease component